jgi:DNA-binding response OmpR family regulator
LASLLLVEDEVALLEALTEVLSDAGYRVIALGSGEAAVAALEDATDKLPDIILTDIRLPGMSGIDLLMKVRNHELWKNIPFICLSASIPPQMEDLIAGQTNVAFMRKPFEIDEFLATIRRALKL